MYQDTGIRVDPDTCPLLEGMSLAHFAADPRVRVMPPRVTPTPSADGAPEADTVVIDFWFGLVHGDYVPKPAHFIYRLFGEAENRVYLPLILGDASSR
jgi:hypothetical protein